MLAVIIEEEIAICLLYRRVLEKMGFEVIEALDGQNAISILERYTPNLIFLDMLLPRVNGVTVLNHITTSPRLRQVETVIVSSNKQYESLAQNSPNVHFLLKPIRPDQIRAFASRVKTP